MFDELAKYEIKIRDVSIRAIDLFFFCVILGLAIAVRLPFLDLVSGDYYYFLSHWMDECHRAGGLQYLGIVPGKSENSTINYGCMYQYIIVLLHYLGRFASDIYLIKWVSVIFDIVCSITAMRIAFIVSDNDVSRALMAFGIASFLPTAVLNSAAWAQCDSVYVAFIMLSFLSYLRGREARTYIYFALAYSFKQQAVFILPFYVIMWMKGRLSLKKIYLVPVTIFCTMIPAMIAGRRPAELLSIYLKQANTYTMLSMNYPSIYTFISSSLKVETRKMIISAGLIAAIAVMGFLAYYIWNRHFEITREYMLTLVILSSLLCLFVLPVMHERYGYLPEMLAAVYGVTRYNRLIICAVLQCMSIVTYSRFLFGSPVRDIWPLTIIMFVVIACVGHDLMAQMDKKELTDAG
ncbi:MAG: hypothetical protein K6E91_13200 [Butyrivibrio sp.]|nr:hypothetical protein [Butyrivibrio sp.]